MNHREPIIQKKTYVRTKKLLTNRAQFNVNRPNNILQDFGKRLARILKKNEFLYTIISNNFNYISLYWLKVYVLKIKSLFSVTLGPGGRESYS